MKIEHVVRQVVISRNGDRGAGYFKRERSKSHYLVFQMERTLHLRYHLVDAFVLGLSLSPAAQLIDLVLNGRLQELGVFQIERPVQSKLLLYFAGQRRNIDARLHVDKA